MKVKLFEGGIKPTRAHGDDAGLDFYAPEDVVLDDFESVAVDLKVGVQIPIGYFGKMESKSGLNVIQNVQCTGGVIDAGFRGSIVVRMINNGSHRVTIHKGEKIVQMVLIPCLLADVEVVDELDRSELGRNESGWGSTGK